MMTFLRWEDGVDEDVARLGCRNWKLAAVNREGWRPTLGCSAVGGRERERERERERAREM